MARHIPLYSNADLIYGENNSVFFPKAVIEEIHQTEKAVLLYNCYTQQQSWFPRSVFSYHWHVISARELIVFLNIPVQWITKKRDFFEQYKLL